VLDLDGELIPLVSGKGSMGNYTASGHVEGQAALIMRERGATNATLHIDNPSGICGYCTSQVPTLLPRGATLDVRTPAGTVPPSARGGIVVRLWVMTQIRNRGLARNGSPCLISLWLLRRLWRQDDSRPLNALPIPMLLPC
jgi:hypothetical protein